MKSSTGGLSLRRRCQSGMVGWSLLTLAAVAAESNPAAVAERPQVRLQFVNAAWPKVLRKIAEGTGSELVMDRAPAGHWSRYDFRKYSRDEAVRIVNRELEPLRFRLLEQGNYLVLLHLDSVRSQYTRPVVTPRQDQPRADPRGPDRAVRPVDYQREQTPPAAGATPTELPPATDRSSLQRLPQAVGPLVVAVPRRGAGVVADVIHQGLATRAELVPAGPHSLPTLRVAAPPAGPAAAAHSGPAAVASAAFTLGIDRQRNALVIDAPQEQRRQVADLIETIDTAAGPAGGTIQLVACELDSTLVANRLRPAVATLVAQRPRNGDAPAVQRVGPERDAQAPAAAQAAADPLVQLEGLRGPVSIQDVPGIGMVVTGNPDDVEAVVRIIRELERVTSGVEADINLLLLRHVDSVALAELLNNVYQELTSIRTVGANNDPAVAIIPIVRPNAVLLIAGAADLPSVLDLADKLDQPIEPNTEFEVFAIENAIASEIVNTLDSMYGAEAVQEGAGAPAGASGQGLRPRVQAVADVRTNSVIVQAAPRDLAEVARLIKKIDRDSSSAVSRMRVFELKNAVADELAEVINGALESLLDPAAGRAAAGAGGFGAGGQQAQQSQQGAKSVVLEFFTKAEEGEQIIRSGLLDDIRVSADPRVNGLIVTAPEQSMVLLAELIRQLDAPTSTVAEIKVFPLKNSDALDTVELLESLFTDAEADQPAGVQVAGAEDASSGLIPLRFSVDIRTNSIVAVGGAEALRVVEAIVLRLDAGEVRQRRATVVKLKNSPAEEIATALNGFLQSQRELAEIDPDLVSNVELLEQEIIVVPEPVSNSLLISATPGYYDEMLEIVRQLDEAPAQVVIQVLIVEVDLQNTDEFGVELGFQDSVLFGRGLTNIDNFLTITESASVPATGVVTTTQRIVNQEAIPGFLFNNQQLGNNTFGELSNPGRVGSQGLSNFSLGRINGDLGFGGLVLSASSESVSALLRALAAQRNVQILSRPQIRTVDNQLASIQVGQQVPVVAGATVNNFGGITPVLGTPQQVGIILQVTPRITPDGVVVMETIANKSRIAGQGVPILTDSTTGAVVESPIFDLTEARATVAVPDGQTIVLGGMITKSEDIIERKVPWLGDVPLLGTAFRYDGHDTRRTELLIFMTPRIIRDAVDNECLKQIEVERTQFLQEEAEAIHGPLFAVPGETPLDHCRQCPPGTTIPAEECVPTEGWEQLPYSSPEYVPALDPLETGPPLQPTISPNNSGGLNAVPATQPEPTQSRRILSGLLRPRDS